MKNNSIFTKKIALMGILCALALSLSFLENLIPPLPFVPPGAKPGFSNIATMFSLSELGFGYGIVITLCKAISVSYTHLLNGIKFTPPAPACIYILFISVI